MTSLSTFLDRPGWSFAPLSEEAVAPLWPASWAAPRLVSRRRGTAMVDGGIAVEEAHGASEAKARPRVESEADRRARLGMEAYARGEAGAFDQVYDAISARVFAYLSRQTRDPSLAADLLQQTFLQMHKNRGSYVTGAPVLPWAFAIARRLFIDECRRKKTDALANSRDVAEEDRTAVETPDEEAATAEAARRVRAELLRLPESQRVAFELLRVEGLSHDDAARLLGVTVSAIKLRAFRAYTALRAVLGDPSERPR